MIFLSKTENGFLPSDDHSAQQLNKLAVGEEVEVKVARNVAHHRKGMALLRLAFNNQDKVDNFDAFRMIMTLKAGYIIWTVDKNGNDYPLPQSLSFQNMSQEKFEQWYTSMIYEVSKLLETSEEVIRKEVENFM